MTFHASFILRSLVSNVSQFVKFSNFYLNLLSSQFLRQTQELTLEHSLFSNLEFHIANDTAISVTTAAITAITSSNASCFSNLMHNYYVVLVYTTSNCIKQETLS